MAIEDNKKEIGKNEVWDDFAEEVKLMDDGAARNESKESEGFDEVEFMQGIARNTLPYLTLGELSDEEELDILWMSHYVLKTEPRGEKMFDYMLIEQQLADVIDDDEFRNGFITKKMMQARKLFCASLYEHAGAAEDEYEMWGIYERFFSFSPSAASYCGGLEGSLELLSIAERIPFANNPLARDMCEEIVYDASFGKGNKFEEILIDIEPTKQLQLMPVVYGITRYCSADNWDNVALNKISVAFDEIENNDESAPLVRVLAESFGEKIDKKIEYELYADWITLDPENDPEHARMIEEREDRIRKAEEEQERLRNKYSVLEGGRWMEEIAPDVAVIMTGNGRLGMMADAKGRKMSLLNYDEKNAFEIGQKEMALLSVAHHPDVKGTIDEKINLDLAEISLEPQVQFLKFMTEADNGRFDKLCTTLQGVDETLRKKLLENFVAADFGADFGDSLLEIAGSERFSSEQVGEILDSIDGCRESIKEITNFYQDFNDGKFAEQYARAANERLTDALKVFEQIAKTGEASAGLDWLGKVGFNYKTAIEALNYEQKSLEVISGVLGDVARGKEGAFAEMILKPSFRQERTMYNLYSPEYGYILLYTRPEGSSVFDSSIEYGNKNGIEASISLITNPVEPFELPNPFRPVKNRDGYDKTRMNKVSAIRIDREGRMMGMEANDANRRPINEKGMVSVDLAAVGDAADTPSGKIARLFSVGNKIRNEKIGQGEFFLNHNTKWFEQEEYGSREGFKELVEYVDEKMRKWCESSPPVGGAESFERKMKEARREARRRVGAKVRKMAG